MCFFNCQGLGSGLPPLTVPEINNLKISAINSLNILSVGININETIDKLNNKTYRFGTFITPGGQSLYTNVFGDPGGHIY